MIFNKKIYGIIFLLAIFEISFSCKTPKIKKSKKIDSIEVNTLSQFSSYIVAVNCNTIKNMKDCNTTILTDKIKMVEYYETLESEGNYKKYNEDISIDVRLKITIFYKGGGKSIFCWSPTKVIMKNGILYSYNEKIENLLISEKLISIIR